MLDSTPQESAEFRDGSEKRLANLRPFQKGTSGNPGGKSKYGEDIKALARTKSKRAFERIVELIESDDERVAMMASKEVLDRAFGKPKQTDGDDAANAKNVTINIVRLADQQPEQPKTIDAEAVVVRKLSADADS